MWKFIQRTLQAIVVFIALGIIVFVADKNSDRLASDLAFLSCPVTAAERLDKPSNTFFDTVKNQDWEAKPYIRLRKDWIRGEIILDWVAPVSQSENGLQGAKRLKMSVSEYSGRDWAEKASRSINRETLLYRVEFDDAYWVERECVPISEQEFNKAVYAVSAATKAKQKI